MTLETQELTHSFEAYLFQEGKVDCTLKCGSISTHACVYVYTKFTISDNCTGIETIEILSMWSSGGDS